MKQTTSEELQHRSKFFNLAKFAGIFIVMLTALMTTSCGNDDDDDIMDSGNITGTWVLEEIDNDPDDDYTSSIKITLKFNKNATGSIVEEWTTTSKATNHEVYTMNFSWSTTADADGNDILRISYVSGDKNTELFPGGSGTVLWKRQYVVTGKILNIYDGDGVWVLNKR